MSTRLPRRVVTGHDASGRGAVISDGPAAVAANDPVGQPTLVLDGEETTVGPGDLVVQRGTDHAWENRSDEHVRMLFVLLDGRFGDGLLGMLPADVRGRLLHDVP